MSDKNLIGDTTYPHELAKKTIECEEFYNLMQSYRWSHDQLGSTNVIEAYQAVIDYVDAAINRVKA